MIRDFPLNANKKGLLPRPADTSRNHEKAPKSGLFQAIWDHSVHVYGQAAVGVLLKYMWSISAVTS